MATKTKLKKKELKRLRAAEETCWTLMLMMGLGMLDIPMHEREMLSRTMQKWVDLGVATGIIENDDDDVIDDEVSGVPGSHPDDGSLGPAYSPEVAGSCPPLADSDPSTDVPVRVDGGSTSARLRSSASSCSRCGGHTGD
jgi:hypothetical protein